MRWCKNIRYLVYEIAYTIGLNMSFDIGNGSDLGASDAWIRSCFPGVCLDDCIAWARHKTVQDKTRHNCLRTDGGIGIIETASSIL